MASFGKWLAIFAAGGILASAAAWAAASPFEANEEPGAAHAEAKTQRVESRHGRAHPGHIRSSHARAFALPAPTIQKAAAEMQPPRKGAPLKVGFGRDIPGLADADQAAAAFEWQRNPDGTLSAAVSVTSASASSVRAALRVENLPANATVRFQAPNDADVFEASGEEIAATLARNAASGDESEAASLYWSPLIEGETIVVEVELPPGTDPLDVRVAIPHVAHLVTSAAKSFEIATEKSAACEVDVMCSASANTAQMDAVARMLFAEGTSQFLCTGTLLADQDPASAIPYLLSANHCVNTQASASSLTTLWFYHSTACNSAVPNPSRVQVAGGAALLYNSAVTDTSFMRLDNQPPAGALFAGWFAGATPSIGTAATGLHHPGGDLLKISSGSITGYLNCTPPTAGQFTCNGATAASGTFYTNAWTSGVTEPGSSGSGLFRSDGKLVGQLYGGSGTCAAPEDDIYGRFDVAFNAALKSWLVGNALTVAKTGSGTVASTPAGIDCGTTCTAAFASGTPVTLAATPAAGFAFGGWSGACGGIGACVVPMNNAASVNASFVQATIPLTVTTSGTGIVSSSPAGISCGTTCGALFAPNSAVTLTASPGAGMVFLGWSGACSGVAPCTLTITGATSVAAAFGARSATTTSLTSSVNPAASGQATTLTATIAGGPPAPTGTVVFFADGNFIPGCAGLPISGDSATCTTSSIGPGNHAITANYSGDPTHEPSISAALTQSNIGGAASPTPAATLVNLSTRMLVGTGDNVLIAGFIIGGTASKTVVVTAIGPSLAAAGIANPLANPTLTLVRSSDNAVIGTNDDWGAAPNAAQVEAAGFAPGNASESAIMMTLPPGGYTAIVAGAGGGTGVGIVAVYEVDHPEVPLANASTRGLVLDADNVMIGGFVIQGSAPKTVVVRASGPSLAPAGIANFLANPTLTVVRSADNTIVASNDDWATGVNAAQLRALGLQPLDAREPAMLLTLPPGAYTAIVRGAGGTTGVGTVEIFAP